RLASFRQAMPLSRWNVPLTRHGPPGASIPKLGGIGEFELSFTMFGSLLPLSNTEQNLYVRFARSRSSSGTGGSKRSCVGSLYCVVTAMGVDVSALQRSGFPIVLRQCGVIEASTCLPVVWSRCGPQVRKSRPRECVCEDSSNTRVPMPNVSV